MAKPSGTAPKPPGFPPSVALLLRRTGALRATPRSPLTIPPRASARGILAKASEAWRKRRYKTAFIAKLSDAESEACETQVWIEFVRRCEYLEDEIFNELDEDYDQIMGQIVNMINETDNWLIK